MNLSVQLWRSALPNCQWHSLDEAPHNLPTERSAEVNAALLSFLDQVAA